MYGFTIYMIGAWLFWTTRLKFNGFGKKNKKQQYFVRTITITTGVTIEWTHLEPIRNGLSGPTQLHCIAWSPSVARASAKLSAEQGLQVTPPEVLRRASYVWWIWLKMWLLRLDMASTLYIYYPVVLPFWGRPKMVAVAIRFNEGLHWGWTCSIEATRECTLKPRPCTHSSTRVRCEVLNWTSFLVENMIWFI